MCIRDSDGGVDLALEGHHQVRQGPDRHPPPSVELRLMAGMRPEIDLVFKPLEARGEPFLFLPAIAPFPGDADEVPRQVIEEPVRGLREEARAANTGLLPELPLGRVLRRLALVHAPLRHLPPLSLPLRGALALGAPADKHQAFRVEQHHADTGPVGCLLYTSPSPR